MLIDLGNLDSRRGDPEVAEADYRRALRSTSACPSKARISRSG
jgi:hypothetical protein